MIWRNTPVTAALGSGPALRACSAESTCVSRSGR